MSKLENLIAELCPDGVEFKTVKEVYKRLRGTPITAEKMKEIADENGDVRIFAGGKTVIDSFKKDIPNANVINVPAVIVQSRGIIDFIFYEKPFTFKNEMWAYTSEDRIAVKFLYYILKNNVQYFREIASGMGSLPQISLSATEDFRIPIPPLEIQREIVRILDKFSDSNDGLISLLQRELILRKKQYEFYRDQLLNFDSDVELKSIESLSKILTPKIKIKSNDYLTSGIYPVIDQGQKFIGGYTNATNVFPKGEYIIFGDHTCIVKFVDFEFAQGADGIKIIQTKSDEILPKFLYYCMSNVRIESSYARHWSKMKAIEIPIPPIETQKKIVATLDRFDKLCNDLTSGIPAEIQARQKQYEYYRDKLLTFKIKEEFD